MNPYCEHGPWQDGQTFCQACEAERQEGEVVSDPDTRIDQLIQAAAIPNLAGLYRAAKQRGLIPPLFEYGQAV